MAGKYSLDPATVLVNAGAGAADIADAFFYNAGLKFGWSEIANDLWHSGAMAGLYPLDLAKVLVKAGADFNSTVSALESAVGLQDWDAYWLVYPLF